MEETPEDISNFCSVLSFGFVEAVWAVFLMETFSECNTEVFKDDHCFVLSLRALDRLDGFTLK